MNKKFKVHVTAGTHWDREWRYTAPQSRLRLTELFDSVIQILEKNPSYTNFCIDGGTVAFEDYLSIRPENKDRLKALIKAGRISFVKWYTLPDMFTVAPETLIRNLLLGQQMADDLGGAMKTGYTATSYGQVSQLPQIYQGFDLETAVFYRGTNKYAVPSLFRWRGKDGSELSTLRTYDEVTRTNWYFYIHFPLVLKKTPRDLTYYYQDRHQPVHMCDTQFYQRPFKLTVEKAETNWTKEELLQAEGYLKEQALQYAVEGQVLAMDMGDNQCPFELMPEIIKSLNKVSPDMEYVQSTLDIYLDAIVSASDKAKMHIHDGEMRFPAVIPGFNGLLGATHSSRAKLKVLNDKCETLLMNMAEPWAAIATGFGAEYPVNALKDAWKALLQNHAHDSICGAAVDQVHEDMLARFSTTESIAGEVTARSTTALFKAIDSSKDFKTSDHLVTVFNSNPRPRKEVLPLIIDIPKKGGSGGIIDPCSGVGAAGEDENIRFFDIVDEKGNALPYHIQNSEEIAIAVESELDDPAIKFMATRWRVLLDVNVPGLGYSTYALRGRKARLVEHPKPIADRPLLARENGVLENEFIRVVISTNGTYSFTYKPMNHTMEGLNLFVDNGEIGSAHRLQSPKRNPVYTSVGCPATVSLLENSEFRGVFKIDIVLKVPAAATENGRDRLREMVDLPITTWLTLEKGSKALKVKTHIINNARDHRLRVLIPSNVKTDRVAVESAFAVESRDIRWTDAKENHENFFPYQPMQNFVDLSDGKMGLAVLNRGMREYEVMDDSSRTLALTLIRTHRAYMTANGDMTPEEYDQYTGLHSFGPHSFEYAIYPHAGDWRSGGVLDAAYDFKVNLVAIQGRPHAGKLAPKTSFFDITSSNNVMVSTLKKAEKGEGLLMRLWNTGDKTEEVVVKTVQPFKKVSSLKLDETVLGAVDYTGQMARCKLLPHKIVTLLFE